MNTRAQRGLTAAIKFFTEGRKGRKDLACRDFANFATLCSEFLSAKQDVERLQCRGKGGFLVFKQSAKHWPEDDDQSRKVTFVSHPEHVGSPFEISGP